MKKHKKARTLLQAYQDPRVESFSDERSSGDGIWLYLRWPYYNSDLDTVCCHEWTVKDLLRSLNEDVVENAAAREL